jgi:hypothetical protein
MTICRKLGMTIFRNSDITIYRKSGMTIYLKHWMIISRKRWMVIANSEKDGIKTQNIVKRTSFFSFIFYHQNKDRTNMKKIIVPLILIGFLSLDACTYLSSKLIRDKTPPTRREQVCSEIKRKIIFNQSDINVSPGSALPIDQARFVHEYKDNNCDTLEKGAQK